MANTLVPAPPATFPRADDGQPVAVGALGLHQRSWPARPTRPWHDPAFVSVLMALSLGLRWRGLWTNYWGDEAIAIGIAAHPLGSLPHYLVNDGSPPLYYVGLHFWMELFGRGQPATHMLSMVSALLAVPAAWWCGERLWGRAAARAAAAMVATCAYLDYYSTETRMYSWLVLMAMLALAFFALAYRRGGLGYWLAAALCMVSVLYLQYYGLYMFAATVVVGLAAALAHRAWPRLRATLVYAVLCSAAFAPWAPQFIYQLHHTGAPWAPHPTPLDFFGDSFNALASAGWAGVVFAIGVAALSWYKCRSLTRPSGSDGPGDERSTLPSARPPNAPSALALTLAVPLLTLFMAWSVGQFVNSWNPRYLGIAVVPALLPLAGALSQARWGRIGAIVACSALAATALPMLVDREVTVLTAKSDAAYLMGELKPRLRHGALVISSEVTDTPVFALDLGPRYRYATPLGLLHDPLVVNWSNLPTRLQAINAASVLAPLIANVPVGGQVVVVNPTTWGGGETPERYASAVEAEAIAADDFVFDNPDLREVWSQGVPAHSNPLYPMEATLFVKIKVRA